jgi:hypothetical protein
VGDNLKNLNHFPWGADSTTGNWKIMSPFKISASAGMTRIRRKPIFSHLLRLQKFELRHSS